MTVTISTRDAILKVLYHIQIKYNVTYSQVKRKTIQRLIFKFYKIKICLSTIDYHLGILKEAGFFNGYRRRAQDEKGRWFNLSSNRQLVGKGLNYLKMLGVKVKKYLTDWAFKGVKPRPKRDIKPPSLSDQMFPQPSGRSAAQFNTLESSLISALDHIL